MCEDTEDLQSVPPAAINMQGITVIAICVVLSVVGVVLARPEEKYTDEYDNVDIDEVLRNERLYASYFNCLKTGNKCTPDGQKLKDILPDALQTKCLKCTDVQKTQSKKVIHFIVKSKPADFKELEALYDPEHIYRTKYAHEIQDEAIVLPS